jgi:hypothetical protein
MPQPHRIGARWVVIDRLVRRANTRGAKGAKAVPARFWSGERWTDDYLQAMPFESQREARAFIRKTFGKD